MVLAPFTPFLSEELYQKLTGGESVHLLDWPQVGHVNELVVSEMEQLREYVNEGLSIRAQNQLKVRQPLASVTIPENGSVFDFSEILKDELNVKHVKLGDFSIDLQVTDELKREGLMREVIRLVQNARKQAGLNIDDRITLSIVTDESELQLAIKEHADTIQTETLANEIVATKLDHESAVKVDGFQAVISLQKT